MTRELVVIEMWAGQLACEGFNWILKTIVKQERPVGTSSILFQCDNVLIGPKRALAAAMAFRHHTANIWATSPRF